MKSRKARKKIRGKTASYRKIEPSLRDSSSLNKVAPRQQCLEIDPLRKRYKIIYVPLTSLQRRYEA
jgi:hypothetical protein